MSEDLEEAWRRLRRAASGVPVVLPPQAANQEEEAVTDAAKHWNVQINIQEVTPKHEARNPNGFLEKGMGGAPIVIDRKIKELLTFNVAADSEAEAYEKSIRLLRVSAPFPAPQEQHLHRASCHGPIGELQCGFPDGPTI